MGNLPCWQKESGDSSGPEKYLIFIYLFNISLDQKSLHFHTNYYIVFQFYESTWSTYLQKPTLLAWCLDSSLSESESEVVVMGLGLAGRRGASYVMS